MNQYDRILSITDADKNKYNSFDVEVPVDTAPVGIDLSRYDVSDKSSDSIEVGYIGSLDWRPNIEGLTWFFSDIWPLIHEEHPSLVFHLAGRNASLDFIENLPLGVKYHGEVDDAILFISKLDGVIVPLLSGSGIRIKILESMAMSKTVFSTDKGFEGISIVDQKNGIIFNNPLEMKVKFRDWMNNFNVQTIGSQARELISNQFNITSIAQSIIESLNDNKI
jgi:glycosyltransferase involved in cell wall biosynthesis